MAVWYGSCITFRETANTDTLNSKKARVSAVANQMNLILVAALDAPLKLITIFQNNLLLMIKSTHNYIVFARIIKAMDFVCSVDTSPIFIAKARVRSLNVSILKYCIYVMYV